MTSTRASFDRLLLTAISLLLSFLLDACGFSAAPSQILCQLRDSSVPVTPTASSQTKVFESPNTLVVYHGSACAVSKKSGREDVVTIKHNFTLPGYATQATVLLNGWDLQYLGDDQHVAALGTLIDSIRIQKNNLTWQVTGAISDDDFEESYQSCYRYTIIAWNPSAINLIVDNHDGADCYKPATEEGNFYTVYNDGTTTSLASYPSFLLNKDFASSKAVAILPRGFAFNWDASSGSFEDHHLKQISYNRGHSEIFVQNKKTYRKSTGIVTPSFSGDASQVGTGYASWETSVIFKDDDTRRRYGFGEMVSGLAGTDLGIIEPPFSVLPLSGADGANASGGVRTAKFTITNIPYNYAIPVLSGWDLGYLTSDNHVKEGGVWIDNIHYDKNPTALTGTLTYELSAVLRDNDNWPDFFIGHKVTVLGFQAATGKVKKSARAGADALPDLVAYSPLGNSPLAFSRIEPGQRLRVTVRNQGSAWAASSKTSVQFGDLVTLTNGTPEIAPGSSVDLFFTVPESCADCQFTIHVDAANEVREADNEGNNRTNGNSAKP